MNGLPEIFSLVPQSGVQFIDLRFDMDVLDKETRQFWEQPLAPGTYDARGVLVNLRSLRRDDEGGWVDPATGLLPPEEETFAVSRQRAFEAFLNQWIPLPYFRIEDANVAAEEVHQKGPTNWVRLRIVPLAAPDEDGNTHAAILAFDTALRESRMSPFPSLAPEDSRRGSTFSLRADRDGISWFLNQEWLALWLREVTLEHLRRGWKGRGEPPQGRPCEHFARYLAFLEIIADAALLPAVKLVDVVSPVVPYQPIGVDLVLDIGNSRTCGVLVEHGAGAALNNSFALCLRDLERPERVYDHPFESRVEFAIASFGRDVLARKAGAAGFQWPSPIRVGPEAMRLAAVARGNQGATGLSSPKRYLWDTRATAQVWRANGIDPTDGVTVEPPVTGSFMRHVAQDGQVLRARRRVSALTSAQRAHFSRSSLMTFLLTEVLMHAVSQINSVQSRYARAFPEVPRVLKRILLTMPPAMPLAEQRIFRSRAEAAVSLAWDLLGWADDGRTRPNEAGGIRKPQEPTVVANVDEATATQLVFLYTEIAQRLKGDPAAFFALTGRPRPERYGDTPSLRVASIDIGGGTTDLMICTYVSRHGQEITPEQNFREGFRLAGDEILRDVIESLVLPQIEQALAAAGTLDAKALLQQLLGGERGGQTEAERHLQRQFVSQVLEPVGLAIIHAYEASGEGANEILRASLGELLKGRMTDAPVAFFQRQAERAGARDLAPLSIGIAAQAAKVDRSIRQAIGETLGFLCEVVNAFDCDWLLVSGRPSRLRAVMETLVARLPVPPHRIVGMHNYVAGGWYPFRDPAGRISDPKTTAAVGAMLSIRAEGGIEGFLLRANLLRMKSTARFLGRMDLAGKLPRANVLLNDPDREPAAGKADDEVGFTVELRAPVSIGFRQLDLERWPVARLYRLEYAQPDTIHKLALPLKVRVRRKEIDPERADAEELREEFTVAEVLDAEDSPQKPETVILRLLTEAADAGYWRDTGVLSVP
jgi:hypothetical protein